MAPSPLPIFSPWAAFPFPPPLCIFSNEGEACRSISLPSSFSLSLSPSPELLSLLCSLSFPLYLTLSLLDVRPSTITRIQWSDSNTHQLERLRQRRQRGTQLDGGSEEMRVARGWCVVSPRVHEGGSPSSGHFSQQFWVPTSSS